MTKEVLVTIQGLQFDAESQNDEEMDKIESIYPGEYRTEWDAYCSWRTSLSLTLFSISTGFSTTLSGETLCCPVKNGIFCLKEVLLNQMGKHH